MDLLERIKYTAKKRGMTLVDVTAKAGIGPKTISNWRNRDPRTETLQKVADVLGVSVDYLLGNTTDMYSSSEHNKSHVDLYSVSDEERNEVLSINGEPISDDDWAIMKAIMAKYPKKG